MNWLERARREMRAEDPNDTANAAERNPSAVTAVGLCDIRQESRDALRDAYEERAAIMQHEGGMSREDAERAASELVYGRYRVH